MLEDCSGKLVWSDFRAQVTLTSGHTLAKIGPILTRLENSRAFLSESLEKAKQTVIEIRALSAHIRAKVRVIKLRATHEHTLRRYPMESR